MKALSNVRKLLGGAARAAAAAAGRALGAAARRLALPLAVLTVYSGGVWCLWQYAASRARPPAAPLADARQCRWLTPRDLTEINGAARFVGASTLYDRDVCRRLAEAYAANPWVERVSAVRRRFPDRIEVEMEIRRPVACVRRPAGLIPVDRSACRLPGDAASAGAAELPVIGGVWSAAPAPGRTWRDDSLADALRLIELLNAALAGHGPSMRLAAVEVRPSNSAYDRRPQLAARTAGGLLIEWGGYSESATFLFPSAAEKRADLLRLLDEAPDLGAVGCISVRTRGGAVYPRRGRPATLPGLADLGAN